MRADVPLFFVAAAGACAPGEPPAPRAGITDGFVDVAAARGIHASLYCGGHDKRHMRQTLGQGLAWLDVDGDGDLDLFAPNGPQTLTSDPEPWRLWVQEGGRFEERAADAGLDVRAWGVGCAVGDVDGDGRPDLFVTVAGGPDRLFRARGDGTFEDWTERSGIGGDALSTGAAFGDLDGDGDLDLVVAGYLDESRPPDGPCRWKGADVMCGPKGFPPIEVRLWLNDGSGSFQPSTALAGYAGFGLSVLLLDATEDGFLDVFVANDSSANFLFVGDGRGGFEERGVLAGVGLGPTGRSQAGMGVDSGDVDGDGRPDIVVTNFSDDSHSLYHNDGGGFYRDVAARTGLARASYTRLGWGVVLEDFDLDGDLDMFLANGHVYPQVDKCDPNTSYRQPMQLLFNDGHGRWSEDLERLGRAFAELHNARGAAAADFDGDGDLDLAVARDGEPPLLLVNTLPAPGAHWLGVRLVDEGPNRDAIGARIELIGGPRLQVREVRRSRGYLSCSPAQVTFGLPGGTASELVVRWPDGVVQRFPVEAVDCVRVVRRTEAR